MLKSELLLPPQTYSLPDLGHHRFSCFSHTHVQLVPPSKCAGHLTPLSLPLLPCDPNHCSAPGSLPSLQQVSLLLLRPLRCILHTSTGGSLWTGKLEGVPLKSFNLIKAKALTMTNKSVHLPALCYFSDAIPCNSSLAPLAPICWPFRSSQNTSQIAAQDLRDRCGLSLKCWNVLLPNTCVSQSLPVFNHFLNVTLSWRSSKWLNLKLQSARWHSWSPLTCSSFAPIPLTHF